MARSRRPGWSKSAVIRQHAIFLLVLVLPLTSWPSST